MTAADDAVQLMEGGMNCAQAVLVALGTSLGIDRHTAAGVASAFGGGMACTGQTCGAVTGGLMVIGLHCDRARRLAFRKASLSNALGRGFIRQFELREGSCQCRQLLQAGGADGDPAQAAGSATYRTLCQKLVHDAVEILEDLLKIAGPAHGRVEGDTDG
jgi:C_GCAxxG_C_C family probable redox protein